jgi:hypothetical protein
MHIFTRRIIERKRLMESVGFVDGSFDQDRLDMLLDVSCLLCAGLTALSIPKHRKKSSAEFTGHGPSC